MALKRSISQPDFAVSDLQDRRSQQSPDQQRRRARTMAKQQQTAERIAHSAQQVANGIAEAGHSRDKLSLAVQDIAGAAEEASSASQQTLDAVRSIAQQVRVQAENADNASRLADLANRCAAGASDKIRALVESLRATSARQDKSLEQMKRLEAQAGDINEAARQVMRIADQTNLLALNAAIEAGRAGRHGKGFAVVADTVRTLAEGAERSATEITNLVTQILEKSEQAGAAVEQSATSAAEQIRNGETIEKGFHDILVEVSNVDQNARDVNQGVNEVKTAVNDLQQGAENVASAASQVAAAAEEVGSSIHEQSRALDDAQQSGSELEGVADELKNSTNLSKSAESVAASAEDLSAAIEELNRGAREVDTALQEILAGAEQAASAAEQGLAAINQIQVTVTDSDELAAKATKSLSSIGTQLDENTSTVKAMVDTIRGDLAASRRNLDNVHDVLRLNRQIDKIAMAIANIAIKVGMLAVNGAVEAARAGEYGKGFAVVSGDIQNLADDASTNVEQVQDLVRRIQDQADALSRELSVSIATVEEDVTKAEQVLSDIETLGRHRNDAQQNAAQVQQAGGEISIAINQSKKGMELIASAAEQAAASVRDATASSSQQAQDIDALSAAIEDIASTADDMQSR